ncbi:PPC domain-containing DNA-binding protein [Sporohalobacter salinus]|uniref:PPC domain-containing DNA-binding protein n=1 Tax=Sporohalobacter salinus TaxID=1494606 RepID=UPI001961879D|nr:PPC domain-containing DNA-binding protein [Sporohalobacter salinus]MBM7624887.1 putative DNA-binding protein with PD1-like motif [Sporohalobacter salinus]
MAREYEIENVYMGRLDHGSDLIKSLTEIVKEKEIRAGKVTVIGAVKEATIAFYDQKKEEYNDKKFTKEMEIVNCIGNISLKDGEPIVHAHISFGDEEGNLFGGHLAKGTTVFASEYIIEEYAGEAFVRGYDDVTGLPLWKE